MAADRVLTPPTVGGMLLTMMGAFVPLAGTGIGATGVGILAPMASLRTVVGQGKKEEEDGEQASGQEGEAGGEQGGSRNGQDGGQGTAEQGERPSSGNAGDQNGNVEGNDAGPERRRAKPDESEKADQREREDAIGRGRNESRDASRGRKGRGRGRGKARGRGRGRETGGVRGESPCLGRAQPDQPQENGRPVEGLPSKVSASGVDKIDDSREGKRGSRGRKGAGPSHAVDAEGRNNQDGTVAKDAKAKPTAKSHPAGPRTGEPSKTVLFVSNLPFDVDDAVLRKLFVDGGLKVLSAHVAKRRPGRGTEGGEGKSKGFGFVEVKDEDEQKKAISLLSGKSLEGRKIKIKAAIDHGNKEEKVARRETEQIVAAARGDERGEADR